MWRCSALGFAVNAGYIHGNDVARIKGKTKRTTAPHVPDLALTQLPESILRFHQKITLCADIFLCQRHSISTHHLTSPSIQSSTSNPKRIFFYNIASP